MKIITFSLSILFVFNVAIGNANDFKWKTLIDSVLDNGFHKIILSPDVLSGTETDCSDLRIYDSKHNEVPYILRIENRETESLFFKVYKILENNYLSKKAITRIVVHNQNKAIIASLVLKIRNTNIVKEITLKGSDNQLNWFIIENKYKVLLSHAVDKTFEYTTIDFPNSNYEYFEITLNDKRKDPLQVMDVGYFDSEIYKGAYSKIPKPTLIQYDSSKIKKSFIFLKYSKSHIINQLELRVEGPVYYLRKCNIGLYKYSNKKRYFEIIASDEISSERSTIFSFNNLKTSELVIEIDNADNVPLKIVAAETYQLSRYLIANLKTEDTYELFWGNEKLSLPNYDIRYFTEKINSNIPVLNTKAIISLPKSKPASTTVFFSKAVIWIAIVAVILLLGYLTLKITREIRQSNQT